MIELRELRESMILNLKAFVKQSSTRSLITTSYISYYRGLNVTTSFGKGRCSHVPWISFCGDQQTTSNGVYPVLLLYKSINILVLAYGVSSLNKPKFEWNFKDGEKQTIKSFLQDRKYDIGRKDLNKYLNSYVYKAYDLNVNVDYGKITDDLDSIISIYQEFLVEKLGLNKTAPFIRSNERDEYYKQEKGENKHKATSPTPISTSTSVFYIPKIAISYSWDNDQHKEWVLKLATDLQTRYGISVTLDVWDGMKLGKLLTHFMEHAITDSDRVICVMTPNYKKKTDNLEGGVGMEYSVISADIQENVETDKYIPLFREGNQNDIPTFLKGRSYVDMRDDANYDDAIETLARDIWNEPKDKKPQIGPKPKFD